MIGFGVTFDANVSLGVFDFLGDNVAQLVEGNVNAGYYQVEFDASGLPSGLYFYRMTAVGNDGTNFIETRKLLLMR